MTYSELVEATGIDWQSDIDEGEHGTSVWWFAKDIEGKTLFRNLTWFRTGQSIDLERSRLETAVKFNEFRK